MYDLTRPAELNLKSDYSPDEHQLLSAMVRYHQCQDVVRISGDTVNDWLKNAPVPRTPLDGLNKLVQYLADTPSDFASYLPLPNERFIVTVAKSGQDFAYVKSLAVSRGYAEFDQRVNPSSDREVRLTLDGWSRVEELRTARDSSQAFVAMSFSDGLKSAWVDGIQPALEANGYTALRLDESEHNDRIDDRIIAEIQRSGLLVADVTLQRTGVYFEAGFALGLHIPVIWCCREDDIGNVHFDTRQFNHVVWKTPDDLRESLSNRIQATRATGALTRR